MTETVPSTNGFGKGMMSGWLLENSFWRVGGYFGNSGVTLSKRGADPQLNILAMCLIKDDEFSIMQGTEVYVFQPRKTSEVAWL